MPHDLPPVASADDSLEAFLSRHSRRSSSIYVAVLILVCAGLGLLPVIRVDVSVQAEGIIRPATEKHEVVAGASGYVERVEVRENDRVQKGSEILKLVATPVDSRREILDAQLREIDSMVRDLEILTRPEQPVSEDGGIRTARYRTERMLYLEELLEVELRREQGMRELTRVREMAALDLTPQSELEEREFALNRLNAEKASLSQGFLGGWQARLEQLRTERLQLLERRSLLAEESARFVIRAPIEGTIEQMANISHRGTGRRGLRFSSRLRPPRYRNARPTSHRRIQLQRLGIHQRGGSRNP
jgi:HlyD family secretion protein